MINKGDKGVCFISTNVKVARNITCLNKRAAFEKQITNPCEKANQSKKNYVQVQNKDEINSRRLCLNMWQNPVHQCASYWHNPLKVAFQEESFEEAWFSMCASLLRILIIKISIKDVPLSKTQ
ncbi:hypothetical protein TNCV_5005721 [Trichonephila clavipes]|nr:hypothetical protein TNCV_5005721 [Trichonephila clavipes]